MLRKSLRIYGHLSKFAGYYQKVSGYLASACGLFVLIDTKKISFLETRPFIRGLIEAIQANMFFVFCIFILLAIISQFLARKTKIDTWKNICFILDKYQEKCFPNNKEKDLHRVTLFRFEKFNFFRRHWSSKNWFNFRGHCKFFCSFLVPVARSGHVASISNTFFRVGDKQTYEGIAGMAYRTKSQIAVNNLPDLTSEQMKKVKDKKRLITEYAKQTSCNREMIQKWVDEGKTLPRSIAATPVEVNGQIWGVLVLDSTSPESISNESISDYTVVIAVIGKLLERT